MHFFFEWAWLIPIFPLLAFVAITLLPPIGRDRLVSAGVAILALAASTLLAWGVLVAGASQGFGPHVAAGGDGPGAGEGILDFGGAFTRSFRWAPVGTGILEMGYRLDAPVALMLAMVTLASLCIHIFSLGYMAHDEYPRHHQRQSRFFSFIALFTAAMLTMVMADHLLLFFIAWEIMGLCSYLLIGFWYFRQSAYEAAKKAFITTRIGDVGMLLGIVLLYNQAGSLQFGTGEGQIFNPAFLERIRMEPGVLGFSVAAIIAVLLFMGTIGKSAQFPLHVWLPDAMEGPTPVSALIHAATMVAAGVFLVARTYPIFQVSGVLPFVAFVGTFTALFAALIAVAQYDIKRILAYSTLSQLGFMVAALGIGAWLAALFHLLTHAFFKALLFLGSGSVIHGMEAAVGHDPAKAQDIRNMGGLKRYMPTTFWTYLVGYLALAGIFPFAGFWSKDEILLDAWNHATVVWIALTIASFLTAFYMTRQIVVVFFGNFRGHQPLAATPPVEHSEDEGAKVHEPLAYEAHAEAVHGGHGNPHESPPVMTFPLVVLAIFAALSGFANAGLFFGIHWLAHFTGVEAVEPNLMVAGIATLVAAAGIGLAWLIYRPSYKTAQDRDPLAAPLGPLYRAMERKFGFDELYQLTVIRFNYALGAAARWIDERIIDRFVNLTGLGTFFVGRINFLIDDITLNSGADALSESTIAVGDGVRNAQSGKVQDYVAFIFAGAIILAIVYVYAL
ncbi:MAG: NADH-quinone oxidoreductase subunit L [Herpetosiphonaceae bacterium]|nr:MAG: NADH-quinone oxidoreductase subunit L [Herpetosiphonaceae bacterium]